MNCLSVFAEKVLKYLEPDESKWGQWTTSMDLFDISSSECVFEFCERIQSAIESKEKVLIAGDYDCDGIMATTIMVSGLRSLGLECGFYIPDRIKEGYGLSERTVDLAYRKGYSLIITVDNGVKADVALKRAAQLGIDVMVTDHHMLDGEVDCLCLVHPDYLEPCFSTLCGAAIAFELMRALGCDNDYLLSLAGIACVSDMMVVTGETRALIQNAIKVLNRSHESHVFGLASDRILNEKGIAFQIVPKLNAIGRLSNLANANNVVRYFLSNDEKEIYSLQSQIQEINTMRKRMSDQMCQLALKKCSLQDDIIVVEDPSFHEGIIGLVAGSLCSKSHRPCIVLAKNEEGYKASMRSPDGFHCMEFLKEFDDFQACGGHANAAGFSLNIHSFPGFLAYVKKRIQEFDWCFQEVKTLVISDEELSLEMIESLDVLRPFGPGFEMPKFEIMYPQIRNFYDFQNRKHRRYTLDSGLTCMRFNQPENEMDRSVNAIVSFIGSLEVNQYQGRKQASFVIEEIKYIV